MSKTFIVLLGLSLLATFGYYCVYVYSSASIIQNDIDSRTNSSFDQIEELQGITISTDGRDVTLSGEVANQQLKQKAAENALSIYGVRKVNNQITVTNTEPEAEVETEPNVKLEPTTDIPTNQGMVKLEETQ